MFDLGSAAREMSRLVAGVRDDQLRRPTPCLDWTVADLLAHVAQFTAVFTANARRQDVRPPDRLVDDWRDSLPHALAELAQAWREESAWRGRVSAGGVEMDASANAVVAIEELTTHAWDLARATGQDDTLDPTLAAELLAGMQPIDAMLRASGQYGPQVPVAEDAPVQDRLLGFIGRDPAWQPVSA